MDSTTISSLKSTSITDPDRLSNSKAFRDEYNSLMQTYRMKEYRRHGRFFKIKRYNRWIRECSLREFVWNYAKNPRYANALVDYLDLYIVDENEMKQWINNINIEIDPDNVWADGSEAFEYLAEHPDQSHTHIITGFLDYEVDNETPPCGLYSSTVDASDGDLFHGIVIDEADIDNVNNIQCLFESDYANYLYMIDKEWINQNLYILYEDDHEGTLYYVPLFDHPIPLVHLGNNGMALTVTVGTEVHEEFIEPYFMTTAFDETIRDWLSSRYLNLQLRDGDTLRVGPQRMYIVSGKKKRD